MKEKQLYLLSGSLSLETTIRFSLSSCLVQRHTDIDFRVISTTYSSNRLDEFIIFYKHKNVYKFGLAPLNF